MKEDYRIGQTLYRIEDRPLTTDGIHRYRIEEWRVSWETPHYWILEWGRFGITRRMKKNALRPFAFPTKEAAAVSYYHRKRHAIEHFTRKLQRAQILRNAIANEFPMSSLTTFPVF